MKTNSYIKITAVALSFAIVTGAVDIARANTCLDVLLYAEIALDYGLIHTAQAFLDLFDAYC